MTHFDAFIFDMDGLLLDSERLIIDMWKKTAPEFGYKISEEVLIECIGRNINDTLAILQKYYGNDLPYQLIRKKSDEYLDTHIAAQGIPLKPGAREILSFLKQKNLPLGLATSTSRPSATSRLKAAGLLGFFSQMVCGDEVKQGKPHPEIFIKTAALFGCPPAACVVFEDSPSGAQAAVNAGMRLILVPDLKPPSAAHIKLAWRVFPSLSAAQTFLQSVLN